MRIFIDDIRLEEEGFDGFLISDWWGFIWLRHRISQEGITADDASKALPRGIASRVNFISPVTAKPSRIPHYWHFVKLQLRLARRLIIGY